MNIVLFSVVAFVSGTITFVIDHERKTPYRVSNIFTKNPTVQVFEHLFPNKRIGHLLASVG